MAPEEESTTTTTTTEEQPQKRFESGVSKDRTTTFDVSTGESVTKDDASNSDEFDINGLDLDEKPEGGDSEQEQAADAEDDKKPADEDAAPDPDALPEYDAEKPEVVEQYEKRYFTDDGKFNQQAVSAEYWKSFNAANGDVEKAGLPEGTYKFLEATMGVTKEAVKQIERSLVAQHQAEERSFFDKLGPGTVERYNAALKWAKDGGYSEEQKARFRQEWAKGGDAKQDAVDALMARHQRAVPTGQRRGPPPPRRGSSPRRDATGNAATGAPPQSKFTSLNEYQQALYAAQRHEAEVRKNTPDDREKRRAAEKAIADIRKEGRRSFNIRDNRQ